jgi:glucuronosyltransferase
VSLSFDQHRNARTSERNGFGIAFDKTKMSNDNLAAALRRIFTDKTYAQNATRMSRMLHMRPTDSEQLIVKWTQFLAEFKTLPNLSSAGKRLSFIQYYSLDSIAVIVALVILTLISVALALKGCVQWLRWLLCSASVQNEKKKQ